MGPGPEGHVGHLHHSCPGGQSKSTKGSDSRTNIKVYTAKVPMISLLLSGWFFPNSSLTGVVASEAKNLGIGNMKGAFSLYFRYVSLSLLLMLISSPRAMQITIIVETNHGRLAPGFDPPQLMPACDAMSITP